jgi:hypothetical protein
MLPDAGKASSAFAALVCIDFDSTLAVRDVAPWDTEHVFGDAARHARIEAWLLELDALGATLAIVSRNSRGVVKFCLDKAGWTALFGGRVYTGEDVERYSAWNGHKSPLLRKVLIEPNRLRVEDVLLVDDQERVLLEVRKAVPGMSTRLVAGPCGLEPDDLAHVTAWARARVAAARAPSTPAALAGVGRSPSAEREPPLMRCPKTFSPKNLGPSLKRMLSLTRSSSGRSSVGSWAAEVR